jgi:hypothetical protein
MSNVNPPAEMIAASEVYDTACRTLQNIGQLEVDREIIARGILRAAKTGEFVQPLDRVGGAGASPLTRWQRRQNVSFPPQPAPRVARSDQLLRCARSPPWQTSLATRRPPA